MRKISKIIIHCSDSEWGNPFEIDSWHRARNFSKIGYHFVIMNSRIGPNLELKTMDGQICTGRPLNMIGAHCRGENKTSIGICLIGVDVFTPAQFRSLNALLDELAVKFPQPLRAYPHSEFSSKTCPNFAIKDVLDYKWA